MKAALAAVLFLAVATPAHAQGYIQHDWIRKNERYVDRSGIHCCGANHDCFPVAVSDVHEDDEGVAYRGQRLKYGERGIYWVAEPDPPAGMRPWVCIRHGRLNCVFRRHPQG